MGIGPAHDLELYGLMLEVALLVTSFKVRGSSVDLSCVVVGDVITASSHPRAGYQGGSLPCWLFVSVPNEYLISFYSGSPGCP